MKIKHIIYLVLFLVIPLSPKSQDIKVIKEEEVPIAVKSAFAKQHPDIKSVSWHLDKNKYEAAFLNDVGESSVRYSNRGKWIHSETVVTTDSLPAALQDYVKNNYSGYKLKQATLIRHYKSKPFWQIIIVEKTVTFDKNGKFLKEETNK